MYKKYIITLIIITIVFFIIVMGLNNPRVIAYMNWKIYLPKPQKIDIIYNFEFSEGEDLEIWYYKENKIQKIINSKYFKNINKSNKEFLEEKLNNYYQKLNDDEKELFNKNTKTTLLLEDNYFAYVEKGYDSETWALFILDYRSCKLYYISDVY